MSVTGSYILESNDNYDAWLTAMGMPAEAIAPMVAAKPTMEMKVDGDKITANIKAGEESVTTTLTSGQDSKATLPGGIEFSVNLTWTDNEMKGSFTFLGKTGTAVCAFTDAGFTQTVTAEGVTAKRIYKRQ